MTVLFIIIAGLLAPTFLSDEIGAILLVSCLFIDILISLLLFAVDLGFRFREKPMNNPPSHGEIIFNELRGLYNDMADHISKTEEKRSTLAQRAITLYSAGKIDEVDFEKKKRIIMESISDIKALEAFIKECTKKPNRNWFVSFNKAYVIFGKMMFSNKDLLDIWERSCSYSFDIYHAPIHYWRDSKNIYHKIGEEDTSPINPEAFPAKKRIALCNDGKLAPSEQFALLTWRKFQVMERAIDNLLSQVQE